MALSNGKLLLLLGVFLPTMVMAREWYVKPTAKLRAEYNDNMLLRQKRNNVRIPEAYGYQATFSGVGGVRSEISDISIMNQVDVYRYWGQKNLDRDNWTIGLNGNYSLTERSKVGLGVSYFSGTSLSSINVLQGDQPNNVPSEQANLVGNFSDSEGKQVGMQSLDIAPRWSYQLSETKAVSANYTHHETTYDINSVDPFSRSFRSYDSDSVGVDFQEQWSASTSYSVGFNALHYVVTSLDTKNYGLTFGVNHNYSDTLSFNFMAGGRITETEASRAPYMFNGNQIYTRGGEPLFIDDGGNPSTSPLSSSTGFGPLFGLGLIKKYERGAVNLNYTRTTSPSSIGQLLVADNINFNASYDLTEQFKASLAGSAIFSSSTVNQSNSPNSSGNFNRSYYSVSPTLSWVFSRQLSLNGGYRYQTQQYDNTISSVGTTSSINASSNNFFVYFDYHLDELATSRF